MSTSLLELENSGLEAASDNAPPSRLDGLLTDCLNCAFDHVPHSAGRESQSRGGGASSAAHRRQARFGRSLPGEHLDA